MFLPVHFGISICFHLFFVCLFFCCVFASIFYCCFCFVWFGVVFLLYWFFFSFLIFVLFCFRLVCLVYFLCLSVCFLCCFVCIHSIVRWWINKCCCKCWCCLTGVYRLVSFPIAPLRRNVVTRRTFSSGCSRQPVHCFKIAANDADCSNMVSKFAWSRHQWRLCGQYCRVRPYPNWYSSWQCSISDARWIEPKRCYQPLLFNAALESWWGTQFKQQKWINHLDIRIFEGSTWTLEQLSRHVSKLEAHGFGWSEYLWGTMSIAALNMLQTLRNYIYVIFMPFFGWRDCGQT